MLGEEGTTRALRLVTAGPDDPARRATMQGVERALEAVGASVSVVVDAELRGAMDDHFRVLVVALLSLAALMALVGGVGLASTLSASVAERTRELGVLRAIGATPATVVRVIVTEGLLVGVVSWLPALAFAGPVTLLVGSHVGAHSLVIPPEGPLVWLAIVLAVSAVASAVPAWRASRLTIREALAYA